MNVRLPASYLVCACLLLGGCTTFDHEWKTAGAFESGHLNDLSGRWQGVWASDVTGHSDKLRCVIEAKPDGTYRARFHASYKKVLSFGYTVLLTAQREGDEFTFHGDASLGWYAGGLYHYEGRASISNFFSTYSCKYDHGTFRMERPVWYGHRAAMSAPRKRGATKG